MKCTLCGAVIHSYIYQGQQLANVAFSHNHIDNDWSDPKGGIYVYHFDCDWYEVNGIYYCPSCATHCKVSISDLV